MCCIRKVKLVCCSSYIVSVEVVYYLGSSPENHVQS